jgi:3-oxoacyl-[acyl-carrier protein] reductase
MSERELSGLAAIVTGAGKNIGRAIALDLAEGGASVAIVVRSDVKRAAQVVKEIEEKGGMAVAIHADVAEPDDIARMIAETVTHFGRIDILVNNAGIRPESPIEEISLKEWRDVMHVSLEGPFLCVQAALSELTKHKGTIVNIGGLTAYVGAAHRAHVVAAKAGLDGLTKALAVELAPRGITVNLVSPGMIDTHREGAEPHHRKARTTPLGRRGKPEDVASIVRYLAGPKGRYLTGQTIHVNGGVFLP